MIVTPSTEETTMTASLAQLLRESTQEAHTDAENASFMSALMGGELAPDAYVDLLDQYWHFYRALETRADRFAQDERIGSIVDRRLDRLPSIEADIRELTGREASESAALPATVAYVAQIMAVPDDQPERFLAHHYLRYLGDLSGGQVVARLVSRHYGVAPEGLSMYRFAGIEKVKPYKDLYRDRLSAMDFSPEEKERMVAEARAGFAQNKRIFDELGARHLPQPSPV